jgi:hypothetical protein
MLCDTIHMQTPFLFKPPPPPFTAISLPSVLLIVQTSAARGSLLKRQSVRAPLPFTRCAHVSFMLAASSRGPCFSPEANQASEVDLRYLYRAIEPAPNPASDSFPPHTYTSHSPHSLPLTTNLHLTTAHLFAAEEPPLTI